MTKYHRPGQDGLRLFANRLRSSSKERMVLCRALEAGGCSHAFFTLYDSESQPDLFKRWRQFIVKVNSTDLGIQRLWAGMLVLQY